MSAERFQQEVEANRRIVVGVNDFTGGNEEWISRHCGSAQRSSESRGSGWRTCAGVGIRARWIALERLARAAENDENLMEPMLEAVRAYATLGEVRYALERIYGRFREPVFF